MTEVLYGLTSTLLTVGLLGFIVALVSPKHFAFAGKLAANRKNIGLSLLAFLFVCGTLLGIFDTNQQTPPPANASLTKQTLESEKDGQAVRTGESQSLAGSIEVKIETKTEAIPFQSSSQNDAAMASGATAIAVAGVNGERTLIYEVSYKDGQKIDEKLVKTEVTKQPVNQVTKVGTKVTTPKPASCSSGYYRNSAGNCIKSPSTSPSGATAKCRDGTYSYSQSRRGTCSHHGGVAQWL